MIGFCVNITWQMRINAKSMSFLPEWELDTNMYIRLSCEVTCNRETRTIMQIVCTNLMSAEEKIFS